MSRFNLGPNRVVDEQTGRFRRVRVGEVGRTQIATKEKGMHSSQETKVTAQKSQAGTATISASVRVKQQPWQRQKAAAGGEDIALRECAENPTLLRAHSRESSAESCGWFAEPTDGESETAERRQCWWR